MRRRLAIALHRFMLAACVLLSPFFVTAHASESASAPRAKGGTQLFEALERADLAAVVEIVDVVGIDDQSHRANARLASVLRGTPPTETPIRIAWEELSPAREPRFAAGDRVLVALEPLPSSSLWRRRIADPEMRELTLGVAIRGEAFLAFPGVGEELAIGHYLALPRRDREASAGVAYLTQMLAESQPLLAGASLDRLDAIDALDVALTPESAQEMVVGLLRTDAGDHFGASVLRVIDGHRLTGCAPHLEVRVAREPLAPPLVFAALGVLNDGLPSLQIERLLSQTDPAYRTLAARFARGHEAADPLAKLVRDDPASTVRAAALSALARRGDANLAKIATAALSDPAPEVQRVAAETLSELGDTAIPMLSQTLSEGPNSAARAAVGALQRMRSAEARELLEKVAKTHRDAGVRTLATLALGRPLAHD